MVPDLVKVLGMLPAKVPVLVMVSNIVQPLCIICNRVSVLGMAPTCTYTNYDTNMVPALGLVHNRAQELSMVPGKMQVLSVWYVVGYHYDT